MEQNLDQLIRFHRWNVQRPPHGCTQLGKIEHLTAVRVEQRVQPEPVNLAGVAAAVTYIAAAADTVADVAADLGLATAAATVPAVNRAAIAVIAGALAIAATASNCHARGARLSPHWRARIETDLSDVCIKLHIVLNTPIDQKPPLRRRMRIRNPIGLGAAPSDAIFGLAAAAATTSAISTVAITSTRATTVVANDAIAADAAAAAAAAAPTGIWHSPGGADLRVP